MKVIMFGHKRIPSREGGVEIVVEKLSTGLAARGHDVTCYNRKGHHVCGSQYDYENKNEYNGVNIKTVATIDKKGLAAVSSSFFAAVKSAFSDAEVVHIHAEGPAAFCWLPNIFGKRVIVTVHGLDWKRGKWENSFAAKFIKFGEKMAVKYADEIIVLNKDNQNYFKTIYDRDTVFISNGVERPVIKPADLITKKYGLNKDSYILFLGRLVPEKGIHYLIRAFKEIKTEKKLVITGGSSDTNEYVKELKNLSKDDERIIFTDFVEGQTLEELYSNAYIYALPSDLEGMPLSLLEAMSYGNCCLVSDIAECTEVVEDKAIVFKRGNVEELKNKLQMLCDDESLLEKYKMKSSDFVCSKYNWNDVIDKTFELYKKGN